MKVRIQCSTVELSMGQCFKQIISEHGFRGLYRGMLTPLMFATPVSALAFSGNGWAQNNFLKNENTGRKAALCGTVGGFTSALLACPAERVKCILQNDPNVKSKYHVLSRTVSSILSSTFTFQIQAKLSNMSLKQREPVVFKRV